MQEGRALVTGITGAVGRRLGPYLVEQGCEVHGLARFQTYDVTEDDVRRWGATPWRRDLLGDPL